MPINGQMTESEREDFYNRAYKTHLGKEDPNTFISDPQKMQGLQRRQQNIQMLEGRAPAAQSVMPQQQDAEHESMARQGNTDLAPSSKPQNENADVDQLVNKLSRVPGVTIKRK